MPEEFHRSQGLQCGNHSAGPGDTQIRIAESNSGPSNSRTNIHGDFCGSGVGVSPSKLGGDLRALRLDAAAGAETLHVDEGHHRQVEAVAEPDEIRNFPV